jgi:hypothetical protein
LLSRTLGAGVGGVVCAQAVKGKGSELIIGMLVKSAEVELGQ